ncbi:MAG: Ldh family oxidoreductase [Pseudomonadota bacterium]
MSTVRISVAEIEEVAKACLQRNGCDDANATAVASVIARAERDGCHSHGLMRLAGYAAALKSGKVNGKAAPSIKELAGAVVQVDGHNSFAPLALETGRDELIRRAQQYGIAALSLVRVHHFAALWAEIEPVTEAGLCAIACTSYTPAVIPAGGRKALYGTNPLAFGWPRPGKNAVIFDQASAVMAKGEVMLAAREGHTLPEGVGVDADGEPTTDPAEVLKGALLAFGGHKGSSIAMMVELLAGGLIGESFSYEAKERDNGDGGPVQGGELMIAINPALFGDAEGWAAHCDAFFEKMTAQDGVRLPSDRRYKNRERALSEGVDVSKTVYENIKNL